MWSCSGRAIKIAWDQTNLSGYVIISKVTVPILQANANELVFSFLAINSVRNMIYLQIWRSVRPSLTPGKQLLTFALQEGNIIAVRACACYPGWELYGRNARLVLEIGEHANDEQPPSYEEVAQTTEQVLTLLNAKNMENNAYTPIVKTVPGRADSYDGKGKDPLLVLSLDGGGVRGYSTLMLLKEVMDKVGKERPCEVFDMIGGTSTGG